MSDLEITGNAIADRAYKRMCQIPDARFMAEQIGKLTSEDRVRMLDTLLPDERAQCIAYVLRRLELKDMYGSAAASMQAREDRLAWLRKDEPHLKSADKLAWVKRYYARDAATLADFVADWGYTIDPRLVSENKNPVMAFDLFPKQREMIAWFMSCLTDSVPGVCVKSRDVGASWVAMALLSTLCIFRQGFAAGVGSAVEIKIDRSGDPDTLFYKARSFLQYLPVEFSGGWSEDRCSAYMRLTFPLTGSSITGEAGDQAGRGGRKSVFVVDESAHFEHPKILDKNLSANTRCRIDMSSVNGMANSFYLRAKNKAIRRFDFTWKDDPRKQDTRTPEQIASGVLSWEDKTRAELSEETWEQEYNCNFQASLEGGCIPAAWARAAVDIDKYLGIDLESGALRAALDVADRGMDLNAYAVCKGRRLKHLEQWSGKGSDTGYSVQRAMQITEKHGMSAFDYDADGMGGPTVHSNARMLNEARVEEQQKLKTPGEYFAAGHIGAHPYRGSEAPVHPERMVPGTKRKAKDLFMNRKAQTWFMGRIGCEQAWNARNGKPYNVELMVCIDGSMPLCDQLVEQLAQAQVKQTLTGKVQIDKNPDDVSSPDLADAALMCWAPRKSFGNNMGALLTAVTPQR